MTSARNGAAAKVAPARAIEWHTLPLGGDDDRGLRVMPPWVQHCSDGAQLLARTASSEVVDVRVERGGFVLDDPDSDDDGREIRPEAIAERPRVSRAGATQTAADRRKAGRVPLQVWITLEQKRRLEWIRAEDGHDYATIVGCHIDLEYEDRHGMHETPT